MLSYIDHWYLSSFILFEYGVFLQISLRWVYEQGVSMVVKSFKKERLKENIKIFDWELSDEEHQKISQIPQSKKYPILSLLSHGGSIRSPDLSDIEW